MAQGQSNVRNSRAEEQEGSAMLEDIQCRVSEGIEQAQQMVSDRPAASLAIGFAVGFGFGIVLSGMVIEAIRPRRQTTTERLGQSMMDALSKVLPESIASRMPM